MADALEREDGQRELPGPEWAGLIDGVRREAAEQTELGERAAAFSAQMPRQLALLTAGLLRSRDRH